MQGLARFMKNKVAAVCVAALPLVGVAGRGVCPAALAGGECLALLRGAADRWQGGVDGCARRRCGHDGGRRGGGAGAAAGVCCGDDDPHGGAEVGGLQLVAAAGRRCDVCAAAAAPGGEGGVCGRREDAAQV